MKNKPTYIIKEKLWSKLQKKDFIVESIRHCQTTEQLEKIAEDLISKNKLSVNLTNEIIDKAYDLGEHDSAIEDLG